jgi:uncharacterized membrane protein YheB (UPF0754 family)
MVFDVFWWLFFPISAAFIGWLTNWLAIKMIFYPRQYIGLSVFGWQGIIHKKSHVFSHSVAKQVSDNMLEPDDLIPQVTEQHIQRYLQHNSHLWTSINSGQGLSEVLGDSWQSMDMASRQMLQMQLKFETSAFITDFVQTLRAEIIKRLDLQTFIQNRLAQDSCLMAELYSDIAGPELRRIERLGWLFGGLIGVSEMILFYFFDAGWMILLFGLLIGAVTNWLAIQMIFKPQYPRKVFGFTIQGLFPGRQLKIAKHFAEIGEQRILTVDVMAEKVESIFQEPKFARDMIALAEVKLSRLIALHRHALPADISESEIIEKFRALLLSKFNCETLSVKQSIRELLNQEYHIAQTLEKNLAMLTKPKFEQVLRVIFQEDEATLIIIGALLGGLISCLHFIVVS